MYNFDRMTAEVELLRGNFPDLEVKEDGGRTWVRLPTFRLPQVWSVGSAEIVFTFPVEVGQPPYAFCVRPALTLTSGAQIGNYTAPVTTPWGSDFGQFSWSPSGPWIPRTDLRAGANMLNFVLSFNERLGDPS
jgi:hypothetical protein